MIKNALVFIALFLGFFLVNCSDSSSNDPESPSSSSLQVDALSSSSQGGVITPPTALKAQPVAASNNPSELKIVDSFTEGGKNWYIIDAGYISNSLIMQMGPTEYSGFGTVTLSMTESIETSMTRSRTETVSNSILISEASTNTTSIENSTTWKGSGSFEFKKIFKVEGGLEKTFTNSSGTSRAIEVSNGKSKETSESFMTSISQSLTNSTLFTIDRGDPVGHYRYAWYTVSDVYFIISTSLDNQKLLSWDVISCARGVPSGRLELSSDGKFDNSPIAGTEIVFADDFYKTLPKPPATLRYSLTANTTEGGDVSHNPNQITYESGTQVTVTATPDAGYVFNGWTGVPSGVNASNASITFAINSNLTLTASFRKAKEKTEETSFTIPGTHTFTFDKFPATIEVYTLGGGGGGQGGHTEVWGGPFKLCGNGRGGGGGGGGAAYIKLTIEEPIFFNITVGSGGSGGDALNNPKNQLWWNAGYSGTDGNPTSVTWAAKNITLTANGGVRGGHNRTGAGSGNSGGGSGGDAGTRPTSALVTDWFPAYGGLGANGNDGDCNGGGGGSAASISNIGSGAPFGGDSRGKGGTGGCSNNNGENGGNGEVKIRVTYYE